MCGICGFTGEVISRDDTIERMTKVITHRGPDSSGFYKEPDSKITMGFRRLSIIDLDAGHQPIYNEDRSMVLTFNGEIYNYRDLRKELIELGHTFYTESDSEVLIHGFEQWQEKLLDRLRGMFGFAIYNLKDNSLFIARDFFGIKPMHYAQVGDNFVYGSEIKSILEFPGFEKKFNYRTLDNYLSFQYAVPPETFFEGVYCLMPGHYLWYKDGKVTTTRYWEARFEPDESLTEEQAIDEIEKVFENSVNAHKISDVEVGCFLSSGVDSSYVSTYFADQKTFTVGFDAEFPPYGYQDENGEYVGFDLDLAAEVCTRNGWELVKKPINWDSKDMELNTEVISCIWNGFTMQGREDKYTWSEAYVDNSQVIVVKKDSGIATYADLAGKIVAVQADSSALAALTENEDGSNAENIALAESFKQMVEVPDYNTAFLNLEAGAVDAIAMDIGVAQYQISQRGDEFVILDGTIASETYGIGFKLGNTELRDAVQKTLDEMAADGTFAKIAEKWGLSEAVCLGK